MAQIETRLSQKVNKDTGRAEILLRLYQGKKYDLYAKTSLFVMPRYFEYYINKTKTAKNGVSVPDKTFTATREEATKKGYILYDRGELVVNARILTDEVKFHKEQYRKLSELKMFIFGQLESLNDELVSSAWLNKTIDCFLNPDEYIEKEIEEVNNNLTIYELSELYISKHQFSQEHTKAIRVLFRDLARFEAYIGLTDKERKNFKIEINTLTRKDIESFEHYLRNEYHYAQKHPKIFDNLLSKYPIGINARRKTSKLEVRGNNTIIKILKRFKTFYKWLNENSYTDNRPFEGIKIGTEIYGNPIYITIDERNKMADYDLSAYPSLEVQRDIFIFQCLVGCRIGDFMNMTQANIVNGILTYLPHKTKDELHQVNPRIPLNQRALSLIEKYKGKDEYGRLFPFISSQKYNDAIKKIFKLCGITRNVVVRDPATGNSEIKPICDIASSHMARRTFAGAAYKKVKDPNVVAKMTGHVEGSKAFLRYRDIDDDMLKEVIDLIE